MKYFTIEELCRSDTARRKGIANTPSEAVIGNLRALVDNVLDPLREWYGKPIRVTSGFRCKALNKAVGGVPNSEHMSGYAADIDVGSKEENRQLYKWIADNCQFTQLIWEHGGEWVHVSYNRRNLKNQVLRIG